MNGMSAWLLGAFVAAFAAGVLGAEPASSSSPREDRLTALEKRLANVEALVGPLEKGTPGRPTFAERLDRLDARTAEAVPEARAQHKATADDFRQLQLQVQGLAADLRDLTKRVDTLERAARADRSDDALRDLRRDLDQLRRSLDRVEDKLP